MLIDIYRNRNGQSIVSPYSIRGRLKAPVSMPLKWDELKEVKSPTEFTIHTVPALLKKNGDAWESMDAYAIALHTHRSRTTKTKKLPLSKHHKSPEQLETYGAKRDFKKTPEPAGLIQPGKGNRFVVHRHHASHIHYDLRLEKEGVLKSWAVPRGLPPKPGIKRLAVQTEDHPMEYLNFEGTIPKGQYGGGDMWVFMQGRYEITKEKKDGSFYFRLTSKVHTGEYRMYQIKQKEWLLERVDESPPALNDSVEFKLSDLGMKIPEGEEYVYEVKWDGIRAMLILDEGEIKIKSRNHRDITSQFPELTIPQSFRAVSGVFDGEIVSLNAQGKPEFKKVINRLMASGKTNIEKLSRANPVYCYIFDCLFLDGRSVMSDSLERRRVWIEDIVKSDSYYRISQLEKDGKALFAAAKEHALEGIMAKRLDGKYLAGKQSDNWIKIKVRDAVDCVIIGYTEGKGNREEHFGSLHVAELVGGKMQYRGRVGTGFDDRLIKEITRSLKKLKVVKKPFADKVMDEKITTWVELKLFAEISYSMITKDNMFREPVFVRLRHDLS